MRTDTLLQREHFRWLKWKWQNGMDIERWCIEHRPWIAFQLANHSIARKQRLIDNNWNIRLLFLLSFWLRSLHWSAVIFKYAHWNCVSMENDMNRLFVQFTQEYPVHMMKYHTLCSMISIQWRGVPTWNSSEINIFLAFSFYLRCMRLVSFDIG